MPVLTRSKRSRSPSPVATPTGSDPSSAASTAPDSDDVMSASDSDSRSASPTPATTPVPPGAPTDAKVLNRLTARWLAALPNKATTFSAVGVWPLLALLAASATDEIRADLEVALGITSAETEGTAAAIEVLNWLKGSPGVTAAVGFWANNKKLPVRPQWRKGLPKGVVESLTGYSQHDQTRLNAWVKKQTDGMIPRMRVPLDRDTLVVLASSVAIRTLWCQKFYEPAKDEIRPMLWRRSRNADIIRAGRDVTTVCVEGEPHRGFGYGDDGASCFDVHLVIGHPGAPPSTVLPLGLAALEGAVPCATNANAADAKGPGLTTELISVRIGMDKPEVILEVPPFTVEAKHNLLALHSVFGLNNATDLSHGHFPGISSDPLVIGAASQVATAEFSALGFSAAALTELHKVGAPKAVGRKIARLTVKFDRPFGFLATHRDTGVVLFAGWVTDDEFKKAASTKKTKVRR